MKIEHPDRIEYRNEQGELHRLDGPAIEYDNGDKSWYINGLRHREDGLPAVELSNGNKYWYINGKLHREDGPAIEWADVSYSGTLPESNKTWYINGINYKKEKEYKEELIRIKLNRLKSLF